eukprot:TRINITY_DN11888_c0_g1_i1.p1 TRINITY_DN11888_c0_g1~~TRINITY_DN11888_c0_g1_i1.p1  ORF type:complete len:165 (+),score=18.31 TRINITY_DN11888_c0_g1_i1:2-496(+)
MKWAGCTLGLACSSLMVWTGLTVARIDSISTRWVFVFIPMWISICLTIVFLSWLFSRIGSQSMWQTVFWFWFCALFVLLFTVLLPIKLDSPSADLSWYGVLTPLWIACALVYLIDEHFPDYSFKFHTSFKHHRPDDDTQIGQFVRVIPRLFIVSFPFLSIFYPL